MKTKLAFLTLLALSAVISFAVRTRPIVVPESKHTISEAVKLTEAHWKGVESKNVRLIAVEWCRSDQFEGPSWFFGRTWPHGDAEWAWFVTYAAGRNEAGEYGSVYHCRVRESGEVTVYSPPQI